MRLTRQSDDVLTPVGPARVHLETPRACRGLLVLGHGAGGGTKSGAGGGTESGAGGGTESGAGGGAGGAGGATSVDLLAARDAGLAAGLAVARVEQPWLVAGRRVAEAPPRLDVAWRAVVAALPRTGLLVLGGRSSGARVACRTAGALDADAVLALAFPLVAPSGVSRLAELRLPEVPVLVLQGERDAFGVPEPRGAVAVHRIGGADHAFAVRRRDGRTSGDVADELRAVVGGWLAGLGPAAAPVRR